MRFTIFSFCAVFLFFSACFGLEMHKNDVSLSKVYVNQEDIMFKDGHLLIINGQDFLYVNALYQDTKGMYYRTASVYGVCPFGHPYTADGGCLGFNCPFN